MKEEMKTSIKTLMEEMVKNNGDLNDRDEEFFEGLQAFSARLQAKDLEEYKELPFKIGDEVIVKYIDNDGEAKSVDSTIYDIICAYNPFTFKPTILVSVKNELWACGRMVHDWKNDIELKK